MRKLNYLLLSLSFILLAGITSCSDDKDSDNPKVPVVKGTDEYFTLPGTSVSFTMRFIDGGDFWMGDADTSSDFLSAQPVHRVYLSGFWLGETEVTQALWRAVMNSSPLDSVKTFNLYGVGDNYPMYWVSWDAICKDDSASGYKCFLTRLNELLPLPNGHKFCLPSEAEWEFAARGGNKSKGYKYSGSNNIDDVAWYTANAGGATHEVKTKAPNELGLYDLSGNVREQLIDFAYVYTIDDAYNPLHETNEAHVAYHIIRGGSWNDNDIRNRSTIRLGGTDPTMSYFSLGFRLAIR